MQNESTTPSTDIEPIDIPDMLDQYHRHHSTLIALREYCDDTPLARLIDICTDDELRTLDQSLIDLESTLTKMHQTCAPHDILLMLTTTIFDNARDLAHDDD